MLSFQWPMILTGAGSKSSMLLSKMDCSPVRGGLSSRAEANEELGCAAMAEVAKEAEETEEVEGKQQSLTATKVPGRKKRATPVMMCMETVCSSVLWVILCISLVHTSILSADAFAWREKCSVMRELLYSRIPVNYDERGVRLCTKVSLAIGRGFLTKAIVSSSVLRRTLMRLECVLRSSSILLTTLRVSSTSSS